MEDIFESDEFLRLEALCNARKLSFVFALSKGGGGMHRPKKGPAFVMSDFFVYTIPEEWDRLGIRTTPTSSWVNPRPLPPLSLPLSQLADRPSQLKLNFIEYWDHFHGVLTESYFCPKLYLTKMPRALVEKWMPSQFLQVLPNKDTLSCADLVLFSAFVQWVKQGTVETGNQEDKIRLGFVALILNLACSLYELDPEKHCKQEKTGRSEPISESSPNKSPKQISCVPSSKLVSTPNRNRDTSSPKKDSPPSKSNNSMKTVIPVDIMAELDKMPNLSSESTPTKKQMIDESDDCIEIIDSPQVKVSEGPEAKKEQLPKVNSVVKKIVKDVYKDAFKNLDITVVESSSLTSSTKKEDKTIDNSRQTATITKVDKPKTSVVEVVEVDDMEEDEGLIKKKKEEELEKKKKKEQELEEEKRKAEAVRLKAEKRAQQKKEEAITNAVSESIGRLIQVVIKLMSKDDYNKFSRKVSKNLNNLDPNITDVTSLKKVIDSRRENIQAEEKNVFVHIKAVFDELKKYKKTGSSDNDLPKEVPKVKAAPAAPQVFRWMDGNDNPGEGDSTAAVVIENADEDDQVGKKGETTRTEKDAAIKVDDQTGRDNGVNINQEDEEVMIVDVPLDEDEKRDSGVVHSNMSIKEKAEFARREIEEAVDDTMEYLITKTEEAAEKHNGEKSGKRKRESSEEEKVEPVKKKVTLTTLTSKPGGDVKVKDDTGPPPTKKKAVLTTLNSQAPEKSSSSKEVEPEKEKSPSPSAMEGSSSSKGNEEEKSKKKVSQKHIEKLEAALKKCSKKIKEYEEKEVDWDNEAEEESNYLMTARLKRRCMQIYSKIAEAKALSDSLDRRRDKRLKCVESRYPEINKKIEKFVNRTKHFPDFQDISKLVRAANKDLHLSEGEMHAEAESIFQSVGKTLKKRREIDDHEVMTSYLKEDQTVDPAHGDSELEKRLQEQSQMGKQKMAEYLDNFYRENVIKKKDKPEDEEDKEDEEVTEDEAVADDADGDGEDENESTSVSGSDVEGEESGNQGSRLPNPKATGEGETSAEIPTGQREKSVSGDICIELPDKSIEKCFADTSNIENEVPKETSNVKDTPTI